MVTRFGLLLKFAALLAFSASPVPILAVRQSANGPERFDVVSIKPCQAPGQSAPATPGVSGGRGGGSSAPWDAQASPGRVYWDCVTLRTLVDQAYADAEHPLLRTAGDSRPPRPDLGPVLPQRVRSGPAWADKEMFTIEATTSTALTAPALAGSVRRNLATLPPGLSHALRAALEDRFQLKVHRATEEQQMFALRVSPKGLNQQTVKATTSSDCVTSAEYFATDPADRTDLKICGRYFVTLTSWEFTGGTFDQLAKALVEPMGRYVLDETANTGTFNFTVVLGRPEPGETFETRGVRAVEALGMKLIPTKSSAEYLVIDRAEHPTPNTPAPSGSSRFALPIIASQAPTVGPLRAYIVNGSQKADEPINAWANEASLSDPQNPGQRKIRGPECGFLVIDRIERPAPTRRPTGNGHDVFPLTCDKCRV